MSRLTEAVADARSGVGGSDPLATFEAIGHGYLRWALANPTHFEIVSSRTLIDFNSSDVLRDQNDAIRRLRVDLLTEARARLRDKFLTADVGITGANFLIAETGSSVIVTNEGNGDLTQTLPRVHIALASIEDPVSATRKLAPVRPTSASRNFWRST